MSIIERLSSRVGDRTERSNKDAAIECLRNPSLLAEINRGLLDKDEKLVGDCGEVATTVAMENPHLIVPLSDNLLRIIEHKYTRARWEAVHAVSLIAEYIPDNISEKLSMIEYLAVNDKSIIVRDYSADIIANYAKAGRIEAEKAFPILKRILYIYDGRHAGHALNGLKHVVSFIPDYKSEIIDICYEFISHKKSVIAKTAKSLLKFL